MPNSRGTDGLRSEDLRAALADALAGRGTRLHELLARHGGLPGPRANHALAAAFGEAIADAGKDARRVLDALRVEPAAATSARAFLPIASAFGLAARIESDAAHAWEGIFELCADDRAPVRIGLIAALAAWCARGEGNADALIARAHTWLEHGDREHAYAAIAIVLDVLAAGAFEGIRDPASMLAFIERAIAAVVDAPRAAARTPARRKVLSALPPVLARIAASLRGANDGTAWLQARMAQAHHPDLRAAMETTIDRLRRSAPTATIDALRAALSSSQKPPRDPARIRRGLRGRGKRR